MERLIFVLRPLKLTIVGALLKVAVSSQREFFGSATERQEKGRRWLSNNHLRPLAT